MTGARRRTPLLAAVVMLAVAGCGYSAAPHVPPSSGPATPVSTPVSTPRSAIISPSRSTPASVTSASRSPSVSVPPSSSVPLPQPSIVYPPGTGPLIVLNPGHDGGNETHPAEIAQLVPAGFGQYKACDTTGTNTDAGYTEHAFNWDVALRVRTILQAHGVRVLLTRPNDTGVGPCVNQRAAIQNAPGVVASISIHADGAPASGHGFHVNEDSRTPDGASAASVAGSRRLGTALHDALVAGSGLVPSTYIGTDGYVYRDDFAGLNMAVQPSSFLELGNMRNPGDAALLSSAAGRARIAAAVAAGILTYLATLRP